MTIDSVFVLHNITFRRRRKKKKKKRFAILDRGESVTGPPGPDAASADEETFGMPLPPPPRKKMQIIF